MYKTFNEIIDAAKQKIGNKRICVACAHDKDVIKSLINARELGIVNCILVGDKEQIYRIADKLDENMTGFEVIDETDAVKAARTAVDTVRTGGADILMKGNIHTADFTRAVLDKDIGLTTGEILSHVGVLEVPGFDKLFVLTDAGINIAPDLKKKISIVNNAVKAARAIGIQIPKVAALAALELVNQDMSETVDAAILSKMAQRGQIKDCIIDGPLALDNAVSMDAARQKGIESPIAGDADILLAPDIEAGNVLIKCLVYMAGAQMGGIIMGAKNPIVVASRADSHETKLNSIALSAII